MVVKQAKKTRDHKSIAGHRAPSKRNEKSEKIIRTEIDSPDSLGVKLRRIRQEQGLTLSEAAKRIGMAPSTLSKIENGLMSPTYDVLQRTAIGLQIDLADFFRSDSAPTLMTTRRSVTRRNEGIAYETSAYRYEMLATDLSHKALLPLKARIRARSFDEFPGWIRHDGEEFICVLSGKVQVFTEFYAPVILSEGDNIYLDSQMGHAIISISEEEADILWICTGSKTIAAMSNPTP